MSGAWKPGDVVAARTEVSESEIFGLVRYRPESGRRVLEVVYSTGGYDLVNDLADGWTLRPLVVIDLEDREQVNRLVAAFPAEWNMSQIDDPDVFSEAVTEVQAALRSLIAPPKPEEPTGLGAVVRDNDGQLHTRVGSKVACWVEDGQGLEGRMWDLVNAVEILSDGVQS